MCGESEIYRFKSVFKILVLVKGIDDAGSLGICYHLHQIHYISAII